MELDEGQFSGRETDFTRKTEGGGVTYFSTGRTGERGKRAAEGRKIAVPLRGRGRGSKK